MAVRALAYDDDGDGPAVVLVHGHPFDRTMWEPQRAALVRRFRVVVPDLRGYGASPVTAGVVTMRELAADVEALLDDLGVGTAALVGLSMGGLVVMELALADPRRWWALGLVATTADPVTRQERDERLALADRAEAASMAPVVEAMLPRLFGPGADPEVVAGVAATMRASSPAGAAAALRGRARRPDYRRALAALDVPALVCTGTEDPWSTADVTDRLVAALRDPRVVLLPGVGHLPNLERPEEFDRALLAVLDAAAPGAE